MDRHAQCSVFQQVILQAIARFDLLGKMRRARDCRVGKCRMPSRRALTSVTPLKTEQDELTFARTLFTLFGKQQPNATDTLKTGDTKDHYLPRLATSMLKFVAEIS